MLDKLIQSSQNPEQVSLTIRGALLALVPIVLLTTRTIGLEGVTENFLTEVIDEITAMFQLGFALISTFMIVWGLIRKKIPKVKPEDLA